MLQKITAFCAFGVLLGCPASALAQAQPASRPGSEPLSLNAQMLSVITKGGTVETGRGARPGVLLPAISIGWNNVHATNCQTYYDGSRDWYFLYPAEGGYFYTANSGLGNEMISQCALGNYIGFYVSDSSGTWNQVYTFAFK